MKYMRKNSFVVCLVISAILLTSSFAMPVLAAENTGIETSSVTRSVPGYYKHRVGCKYQIRPWNTIYNSRHIELWHKSICIFYQ